MKYLFVLLVIASVSCKSNSQKMEQKSNEIKKEISTEMNAVSETFFINSKGEKVDRIIKDESEWKKELTEMEFYVLREKGTERSFTGDLLKVKETGVYTCGACDFPLFASDTKYKSGTGWPSFYQPIDETHILEDTDYDLGYARTEVMCKRCGGHLGHVFSDGPKPTGLRYCINSVSLNFEEKKP